MPPGSGHIEAHRMPKPITSAPTEKGMAIMCGCRSAKRKEKKGNSLMVPSIILVGVQNASVGNVRGSMIARTTPRAMSPKVPRLSSPEALPGS